MSRHLQNLDAEQAVIGACLIDDRAYWKTQEIGICAEQFSAMDHVKLWRAIESLAKAGTRCDAITIGDADRSVSRLAMQIAQSTPGSANVVAYAKLVANCALARAVHKAGQRIAGIEAPGDEAANEAATVIQSVQMQTRGENTTLAAGALSVIDELQRKLQEDAGLSGTSTGIERLDALTSGLEPGLTIIAARPSMGKSALALQIALCATVKRKERVLFESIEMDAASLAKRALSTISGVSLTKIKAPKMIDQEEFPLISRATAAIKASAMVVSDGPAKTAIEIAANIRKEALTGGLSMAIVDYLGLIRMSGDPKNLRVDFGNACKILRGVAKSLKIPVILLAQLNRGPETRASKRPVLSDLKESGDIEQDADLIIFVHRESYYSESGASTDGVAELIVAKHRQGETGIVPTYWRGAVQRFEHHSGVWPIPIQEPERRPARTPYGNRAKS